MCKKLLNFIKQSTKNVLKQLKTNLTIHLNLHAKDYTWKRNSILWCVPNAKILWDWKCVSFLKYKIFWGSYTHKSSFAGEKQNEVLKDNDDKQTDKTVTKKRKMDYLKSHEMCKCRKCLQVLGENTKGVRKRPNKHCPFTLPLPTPPTSPTPDCLCLEKYTHPKSTQQ